MFNAGTLEYIDLYRPNRKEVGVISTQFSNSEKKGGTKVPPKGLLAVEHQIRQLFTSIKPSGVVGPRAFRVFC